MSIGKRTVQELLCSVAARTPAPGGGAVAATVGALAAALSEMVINYSRGKPEAGGAEELIEEARRLEAMRDSALALADADAEAFTRLSALWKLKPDDERRRSGWNDAVTGAIEGHVAGGAGPAPARRGKDEPQAAERPRHRGPPGPGRRRRRRLERAYQPSASRRPGAGQGDRAGDERIARGSAQDRRVDRAGLPGQQNVGCVIPPGGWG